MEDVLICKKPFHADYFRMTGIKYKFGIKSFFRIFCKQNLKYMLFLRRIQNPRLRLFKPLFLLRLRMLTQKFGLEIGRTTKIGCGFAMGHPHNITINSQAVIGDNCTMTKGSVLGAETRGARLGAPVLGNCVWVGANAVVVGKIIIGNNVLIAPNSFVNIDVPDNSIVLGNPCKIVPKENATESYIYFLTKLTDK